MNKYVTENLDRHNTNSTSNSQSNSIPSILQASNNYTLMKISGGSFENKANDISLRSMIDAQLMNGARESKIIGKKVDYPSANAVNPTTPQSIFANLISSKLAISHASIFKSKQQVE